MDNPLVHEEEASLSIKHHLPHQKREKLEREVPVMSCIPELLHLTTKAEKAMRDLILANYTEKKKESNS